MGMAKKGPPVPEFWAATVELINAPILQACTVYRQGVIWRRARNICRRVLGEAAAARK